AFCVMCSSLSSLVGGLSYGAHAAGHRFMDAVVQRQAARSSRQTKWLTINYDTWLVPSRNGGLGAGEAHLHILPEEGGEVFLRALSSSESQVLISTIHLDMRLATLQRRFTEMDKQQPSSIRERVANPQAPAPQLQFNELQDSVLKI